MNKITLPLLLVLSGLSSFANADNYSSPTDSDNPPETYAEEPKPNLYNVPPPATVTTPGQPGMPATNPNPTQAAPPVTVPPTSPSTFNNNEAQTPQPTMPIPPPPVTPAPTQDAPMPLGDGSGDDSDTMHDPDPEIDDVGTAPVQPS